MKKVLIILGNYLPNMSANGVCCQKIINEFTDRGYEVTVISNQQHKVSGVKLFNKVENHYVKIPLVYKINNLRKNINNMVLFRILTFISKLLSYVDMISTFFAFPLVAFSYTRNIFKLAEKIYKDKKIDIIIGVNFPTDAVKAVCRMKKKYKDFLFVSYFLDPVLEGRSHKLLSYKLLEKKAISCERQILSISDIVIAQKEHSQHYINYYGNEFNHKIRFLGVPLLVRKGINPNNNVNKEKTVVYAGSLFPTIRNPEYIINVFKQISDIKLKIYTNASKEWLKELAGDADNIEIFSAVSYSEIEKIMSEADALLNIGNSYPTAAPSKIIEYLNYRKPIISTFRVDNDSSCDIIEKYPLSLLLDERLNDCEKAADSIRELICEQNISIDYSILKELYFEETPEAFVESIEEILRNEA